jgi:uncharacterized membrane protein YozB (DUF420 family)
MGFAGQGTVRTMYFTVLITHLISAIVSLPMILKTEMAEGESAAVIGPTRLPASRVASPHRCNRCEPESLVEPSTTPSSSLSIPVSRMIILTVIPALRQRFDKHRKLAKFTAPIWF